MTTPSGHGTPAPTPAATPTPTAAPRPAAPATPTPAAAAAHAAPAAAAIQGGGSAHGGGRNTPTAHTPGEQGGFTSLTELVAAFIFLLFALALKPDSSNWPVVSLIVTLAAFALPVWAFIRFVTGLTDRAPRYAPDNIWLRYQAALTATVKAAWIASVISAGTIGAYLWFGGAVEWWHVSVMLTAVLGLIGYYGDRVKQWPWKNIAPVVGLLVAAWVSYGWVMSSSMPLLATAPSLIFPLAFLGVAVLLYTANSPKKAYLILAPIMVLWIWWEISGNPTVAPAWMPPRPMPITPANSGIVALVAQLDPLLIAAVVLGIALLALGVALNVTHLEAARRGRSLTSLGIALLLAVLAFVNWQWISSTAATAASAIAARASATTVPATATPLSTAASSGAPTAAAAPVPVAAKPRTPTWDATATFICPTAEQLIEIQPGQRVCYSCSTTARAWNDAPTWIFPEPGPGSDPPVLVPGGKMPKITGRYCNVAPSAAEGGRLVSYKVAKR